MSARIILSDTSILLSFICSHNEHFLIDLANQAGTSIRIPNAVANEMDRKLKQRRFSGGRTKWVTLLQTRRVEIISDDDPALIRTIEGWSGPRFDLQGGLAKNLGEYMAIAHAKEFQRNGDKVMMFVDDGEAQKLAKRHGVMHMSSEDVLVRAVMKGLIATKKQAEKIWEQLSKFDVHVPFEATELAKKDLYRKPKTHRQE
ncbi:PIN domain-containing protein [Trueperella bialowiezensis]|uniref:PIN domain-containing protein n=1 Tax=Trueperella bialowiezensis TaxID=312285 RepID=A0A3S4VBH4_9ACTO|nr:hypothetical protein [Trueperella bialowiezensis]VEI13830.1 Uncharacterised protein [Trueperella bialowiezensis]